MRRILNWRLALLFILLLLAGIALTFLPALSQSLEQEIAWVRANPVWGGVMLAALYIPAAMLFVPGTLITLPAGYALGLVSGTIAMSIGSTLGACAAFWAGRTFARDFVARKIAGNPRFLALDQGVAENGFKIVLLTRLSPVFPFNLLNYAFGLTRVRFRDYALASWIGMFPGTVMYVYLGSIAREIADLFSGQQETPMAQKVLLGVGLVATVVVMVLITRIARQALAKTSPHIVNPETQVSHEPACPNSSR